MLIDEIKKIGDRPIIKYNGKVTLPLPEPFIEYNLLLPGDEIEIYRDRVNGRDALILFPKKTSEIEKIVA